MTKILCVEDEEYLRTDIVEELEEAGYEVIQAVNGQDGLLKTVAEKPDLVISDITMPVMDGYGFITKLREDYPECDEIPFIFLSALADRDNVLEGMKLGSDDYMTKPIDYGMLITKVASRLRQASRMIAKKQQEQIKIYETMKRRTVEEQTSIAAKYCTESPSDIVIVGESDQNLWKFQQFLEQMGHYVTVITSGQAYLNKVKSLKADITCFWQKTDDLEIKDILGELDEEKGPFLLVVHQKATVSLNANLSEELLARLQSVLCLPCSEEQIFREIQDCLDIRRVA